MLHLSYIVKEKLIKVKELQEAIKGCITPDFCSKHGHHLFVLMAVIIKVQDGRRNIITRMVSCSTLPHHENEGEGMSIHGSLYIVYYFQIKSNFSLLCTLLFIADDYTTK